MNYLKRRSYILHLIFLFWICSSITLLLSAQDKEKNIAKNWQEMDPSASSKNLNEYFDFLKDSYKWNSDDRIEYLKKGIDASNTLENDSFSFIYNEKIGGLYRDLDSLSLALEYLNYALEKSYNPKSRQIAYNTLGGLYYKTSDYTTALEYYFKSLDEAKIQNNGSEAYPIGNISNTYSVLKDYENAIKYLQYSIGYSKDLKYPEKQYSLVYDYSYVVSSYVKLNQIDSAKHYLDLTLENIALIDTIQQQKFQDARFVGYFAIAEYYLDTNNPKLANKYIIKTEESAQSFYMSSVYILKAKYEILSDNFKAALDILNSETALGEYSGKDEIMRLRAECYENLKQYKKALKTKNELLKFQEEKFGKDKIKHSAIANVKFESLKKSEEIKALKLDQEIDNLTIQNQKYFLLLVDILVILVAFAAIFFWRQYLNRKKHNNILQEQINAKTKNLKKANEELKILSFVASHDLKEPIRNISNFASLIKRRLPDNLKEDLKFHFNTIDKSTLQIYTLVEDIAEYISMSNAKVIEKTEVDLNQLTNELFLGIDTFIKEKNGKLVNNGLPKINTKSSFIYIIFRNLIENGIKFNNSQTPTVTISYNKLEEEHQFIVTDNGIGISKEYHDKIFEGFKKLNNKDRYEGSGIGLAIIKLLLEKLNGTIIVDSKPDKGSSFIINLPI